jgi:hypothetical protein
MIKHLCNVQNFFWYSFIVWTSFFRSQFTFAFWGPFLHILKFFRNILGCHNFMEFMINHERWYHWQWGNFVKEIYYKLLYIVIRKYHMQNISNGIVLLLTIRYFHKLRNTTGICMFQTTCQGSKNTLAHSPQESTLLTSV